jgi:hypothetical protein
MRLQTAAVAGGISIMPKRIFQLFLLVVLWGTAACATPPPATPSPTPPPFTEQHLRVENIGQTPLEELTLLFPGANSYAVTRIRFGTIASNQTSAYQPVPTGVYRYAAYEYLLDGEAVSHPVMDWMGEQTLDGTHFTYQIILDETQPKGYQINLIAVQTDN